MGNTAHSHQWYGLSSRARRIQRKVGPGALDLKRLEELLQCAEEQGKSPSRHTAIEPQVKPREHL